MASALASGDSRRDGWAQEKKVKTFLLSQKGNVIKTSQVRCASLLYRKRKS